MIKKTKPDEIYNLAAQSHVQVSFEVPEYSANVNGLGTLRILEAIKNLNMENKVKFYQAGTSEMFGRTKDKFQNEKTTFYPASPYGASKLLYIGLLSTIGRVMEFLHVMEFYLIMKVQ